MGVPTWECHTATASDRCRFETFHYTACKERLQAADYTCPASSLGVAGGCSGGRIGGADAPSRSWQWPRMRAISASVLPSLASRRRWMGMRDAWVELERNPPSADLLTSARAAALCTHRLHERQGEGRGLLRHEVQRARRPAQGLRGLLGKARRGPEELLVRALWS